MGNVGEVLASTRPGLPQLLQFHQHNDNSYDKHVVATVDPT